MIYMETSKERLQNITVTASTSTCYRRTFQDHKRYQEKPVKTIFDVFLSNDDRNDTHHELKLIYVNSE